MEIKATSIDSGREVCDLKDKAKKVGGVNGQHEWLATGDRMWATEKPSFDVEQDTWLESVQL